MVYKYKLSLFFLFFYLLSAQAQFEFSIETNENFENATAFLTVIEDYNKINTFYSEQIIREATIDSLGRFTFNGRFLDIKNKLYKIYIDKCNTKITNSRHLLKHCDESDSIVFIANNTDTIHFPLNNFKQMFCDLEFSRPQNMLIHKIDSVQEHLLINLQDSKSDAQRQIIYKNYFDELQNYSKTLNEPIAELYTYQLYADDDSFSYPIYLNDLKTSEYYGYLLESLESKYPNSNYTIQFKKDLIKDQYRFSNKKNNYALYSVGFLLLLSLMVNLYYYKKNASKKTIINYRDILSNQEQNVFELMNKKLTNKEIAEKLFISISTVKTHINTIYTKLSITSRKEIHQFFQ